MRAPTHRRPCPTDRPPADTTDTRSPSNVDHPCAALRPDPAVSTFSIELPPIAGGQCAGRWRSPAGGAPLSISPCSSGRGVAAGSRKSTSCPPPATCRATDPVIATSSIGTSVFRISARYASRDLPPSTASTSSARREIEPKAAAASAKPRAGDRRIGLRVVQALEPLLRVVFHCGLDVCRTEQQAAIPSPPAASPAPVLWRSRHHSPGSDFPARTGWPHDGFSPTGRDGRAASRTSPCRSDVSHADDRSVKALRGRALLQAFRRFPFPQCASAAGHRTAVRSLSPLDVAGGIRPSCAGRLVRWSSLLDLGSFLHRHEIMSAQIMPAGGNAGGIGRAGHVRSDRRGGAPLDDPFVEGLGFNGPTAARPQLGFWEPRRARPRPRRAGGGVRQHHGDVATATVGAPASMVDAESPTSSLAPLPAATAHDVTQPLRFQPPGPGGFLAIPAPTWAATGSRFRVR